MQSPVNLGDSWQAPVQHTNATFRTLKQTCFKSSYYCFAHVKREWNRITPLHWAFNFVYRTQSRFEILIVSCFRRFAKHLFRSPSYNTEREITSFQFIISWTWPTSRISNVSFILLQWICPLYCHWIPLFSFHYEPLTDIFFSSSAFVLAE